MLPCRPLSAAPLRLMLGLLGLALLAEGGPRLTAQEGSADPATEQAGAQAIRWLLQPSEQKEWRQAATDEERGRLLERFWRRRNAGEEGDAKGEGENLNRALFLKRVQAAEMLYSDREKGIAGSLTQRGRAHLLLGPPSYLSQRYQKSPRWDPGLWQRRQAGTRPLLVETWGYRPEDLTPALRAELAERGWPFELRLRFIIRDGRTFVLEGEPLLEAAARSFLRRAEEGKSR